ncbi:hypothetical protein POTOM_042953 [Populus tomentosa]|uniref:Protein kinase domain-containing protein n=1 Tax=Populus tomentosa TaxID=118781 RepID=A0A8X7YPR4_POPTO|nr:hypothetical protein POTOM_042953 [Populus tomentosa]
MAAHLLLLLYQHHPIITIFLVLIPASASYGKDDNKDYRDCEKHFNCGVLLNLSYPFWGGDRPEVCGHKGFKLKCEEGQLPIIPSGTLEFRLFRLDQSSRLMTLQLVNSLDYICPSQTLPNSSTERDIHVFGYDLNLKNLNLLYNCTVPSSTLVQNRISSSYSYCSEYSGRSFYGSDDILGSISGLDRTQCSIWFKIPIPVESFRRLTGDGPDLEQVLRQEFNVSYRYDEGPSICDGCQLSQNLKDRRRITAIGVASGSAGILIICIILYSRRKASSISPLVFLKKKHNQDLEDLIRNHVPLPLKRYSFSDVKKMTNFFKDKLGQGGYGTVYKGRLTDGHLVAVKVLVASEGNGEEYLNEVASISRTSHVNIVTLLGFCFELDKRILVFDFMPNGSLEKFINHENAFQASQELGWEKLYQIVIGVARGLEYLHRGCNTRIVHFDIKPHNILLDADFCPKISDFGLAKSCPRKESNVSLMEARGTIGYIAPEVFSRNFGRASYKSDVYSYGMMVLEMVGGKKNHEAEISSGSEKYFPQWIYNHLEVDDDESGINGVLPTSEQADSVRKIIIVGLWCIQTNPADRPSMSKVLEMLEGPIGALKIPPRPFLSSPPRLILYSTTTSLT